MHHFHSIKVTAEQMVERQAPGVSSQASISVWRTRFVQTGTTQVALPIPPGKTVSIPVFSVVPDAAFGVPKKLY